jgi:hypothetical protein
MKQRSKSQTVKTYKIVRMYTDEDQCQEILETGISLTQAQAWCKDPETSSSTCRKLENIVRTCQKGNWFAGYEEEHKPPLRGHKSTCPCNECESRKDA